jgi:ATP-dependent Lhr-like helicase
MEFFSGVTRSWFESNFESPTRVQQKGWPQLAKGKNALLLAPTGSGKTLAAFLWAIDSLGRLPVDTPPGVRVLYVSPLKALVYDVERNLRAPLVGIRRFADKINEKVRPVQIDVRTGDTPAQDRRRQVKDPADILVTTPESLFLLLGSQAAETLRSVQTVIVDEIHAFAPSKRGAHLTLSLERLEALTARPPQRIGLSATVRPYEEAARFLVGQRDVAIVDASEPAHVELSVILPDPAKAADLVSEKRGGPVLKELADKKGARRSTKSLTQNASLHRQVLDAIRKHRTTIVFVNARGHAERLAQQINELADEPLVQSHHGSLSHEKRATIEEALKAGKLKGIVATSSLELGIDMGAIDLVILVESPGSVVRGLQRVGRAGHSVGEKSRGLILPKYRGGDLVECAVVAQRMTEGELEPIHVPENALDVLAQQVVALCCSKAWSVDEILEIARRSHPYRDLSRDVLVSVLDMLSGRYPSEAFADLRPRLNWDRALDVLTPRRGTKMLSLLNAGTIPDRGLYGVHLGQGGPRVGELDEEMVFETKKGEVFLLGASSWRVESITRDQVIVSPAPGEPGKMPFWRGDGPGRPIELGRAIGAFVRQVGQKPEEKAVEWLKEKTPLLEDTARELVGYIQEQRDHTGSLPTDRNITIERFRDELGDWRICILTPFGSRVHAPWALALEATLSTRAGFAVQTLYSDDGIVLRFADVEEELPNMDQLIPEPEEVEDSIVEQLSSSALFAAAFRENAARSLLIPKRRPDRRAPLWQQRLKAKTLMAEVRKYPSFPVILETYRQCLKDVFDVPTLVEVLSSIRRRDIRVDDVETSSASPFSRSLVYDYVAQYLYEQDAPLAERKAQALTLDRNLLRELLGQAELRELLDAEVIGEVEEELQGLAPSYRARHADGLQDLLRRVGDLTREELMVRSEEDPGDWLDQLESERRAVRIRLAGEERWIASEDAARYRDALGILPPSGLPDALLEPADEPLDNLFRRFARTHGPFHTERAAQRFGLLPAQVEPVLRGLESAGQLVRGEIRPGGAGIEWCDTDVLRRLKRRTLAKLRHEVAPVDVSALGQFLPRWHGLDKKEAGPGRLEEAIAQLEGLALPWSALSKILLPARVRDFRLDMLDMLAASGAVVWVGAGPLGQTDGRIVLCRREHATALIDPPTDYEPPSELHSSILQHLSERGASFTLELQRLKPTPTFSELEATLWDLVWAGHITNDTFLPLRSLGRRTRRSRRPGALKAQGGRWSLVQDLIDTEVTPTERAYTRAQVLLERYGVVSRETALAEEVPGGFKTIYGVLKAMEEAGRVRRGYFVEGLSATQFAFAGAVERLRASRSDETTQDEHLLSAVDPANPWGSLLTWPESDRDNNQRPRRIPGAWVFIVNGRPVFWAHPRGRSLLTFDAMKDDIVCQRAVESLLELSRRKRSSLRLARIDGLLATESRYANLLTKTGFFTDYHDLVYAYRP